jgi:hypothetical protein
LKSARPRQELLLFVGYHSMLACGANGQAWQSERVSAEGITFTSIGGSVLYGLGWDLMTDRETPFALDLRTGLRLLAHQSSWSILIPASARRDQADP